MCHEAKPSFQTACFVNSSIYNVNILKVCILKLAMENWKYEPYC